MKLNKKAHKIITHCLTTFAAGFFHLWFSTCRITVIGKRIEESYFFGNNKGIGATWHRGAIFLVWYFRKMNPMIMFSRSRDGDLIAGYAQKLGVIPARGSSSRGGKEAFKQMLKFLSKPGSRKTATVMDGPQGPRFVAKKGMILLAMYSRVPLVPIIVSADRTITLKNTWDKTMIPMPFSNVTVMYNTPWSVPRKMSSKELGKLCLEVEKTLNRMMVKADSLTGYRAIAKKWYR